MGKSRRSYFKNFNIECLFVLMEQYEKQLLELQIVALEKTNTSLKRTIKQIEYNLEIFKDTIVEKYIEDGITLIQAIKLLNSSKKLIREDVYKELVTRKLLEEYSLISIDVLDNVLNKLDVEQLMRIIKEKNNIFHTKALDLYNKRCLEVDDDVYQELILKIKQDRKEC